MEQMFKGKTVIVTGGASNIGRAIVLGFAREGANVVIADIDKTQGAKVEAEGNGVNAGGKVLLVPTDATNWDAVQSMVNQTVSTFGTVDVLVNNLGWVFNAPFLEQSREVWDKQIQVNFVSFLNCSRAVLEVMVRNKRGAIVSTSSDAGRIGENRVVVYSAMKGAVVSATKSLAKEMGRYGIRVNAVSSGTVPGDPSQIGEHSMWRDLAGMYTPETIEKAAKLYPLRRLGKPEEVANAIMFLASDAASFITGETLAVNGGYSMI